MAITMVGAAYVSFTYMREHSIADGTVAFLNGKLLVTVLTIALAPTQSYAGLRDGLISYWQLDGDGTDSSSFARNLTLQGGVGFTTGHFGQSLSMQNSQFTYAQRPIDDEVYEFGSSDHHSDLGKLLFDRERAGVNREVRGGIFKRPLLVHFGRPLTISSEEPKGTHILLQNLQRS